MRIIIEVPEQGAPAVTGTTTGPTGTTTGAKEPTAANDGGAAAALTEERTGPAATSADAATDGGVAPVGGGVGTRARETEALDGGSAQH